MYQRAHKFTHAVRQCMVEQMQNDYTHLQTIGSARIGLEEIQADIFVHTGNHRNRIITFDSEKPFTSWINHA